MKRSRIRSRGRRWKRRKAAGEIEGPLRDYLRELGPLCDSCGRRDDTIRCDHVQKRGMGGARGDWIEGVGNLWRLCFWCDAFKEANNQAALDAEFPDRASGEAIAAAHGENFKRLQEAA